MRGRSRNAERRFSTATTLALPSLLHSVSQTLPPARRPDSVGRRAERKTTSLCSTRSGKYEHDQRDVSASGVAAESRVSASVRVDLLCTRVVHDIGLPGRAREELDDSQECILRSVDYRGPPRRRVGSSRVHYDEADAFPSTSVSAFYFSQSSFCWAWERAGSTLPRVLQ